MRRLGLGVVLCLLAAACLPGLAATQEDCDCLPIPGTVEMSDGVHIDATLYVPNAPLLQDGKIPLIVRQHGGGSNKDSSYDVKYGLEYVKSRKFALLTYSHRGHGKSEGLFDFFGPRTTQDFSEVVDWVATASSIVDTNNIGVSGYSQGGGESLLPAENDERVMAAAVGNTFDDLNHALNPNDCFKFSFATGIFALAYKTSATKTQDDIAVRWGAQLDTDTEDVPLGPLPSTTDDAASRSPMTFMVPDPTRAPFGVGDNIPTYRRGLDIPVFWSNSWEDQLFPADHGLAVLKYLKDVGRHPVHYWFASGGHAAGPNGVADEIGKEAAMREWMEEFLRGESHGFSGDRPEVDYAQKRNVFWAENVQIWDQYDAPSWPPPTTTQSFFAWPDGRLDRSAYNGPDSLGTIANDLASANVANDAISHEVPRQVDDGFRNNGGPDPKLRTIPDWVPEGANPADTATFTTGTWGWMFGDNDLEPGPDPHTYVGAPTVSIPYRTTARNVVQFDVKLWDSHPSSSERKLIWRGCTSISGPGETGTAHVTLWPNAHRIGQFNNQLTLTISTVDFPTFKPDVEPHVTTLLPGVEVRLPRRS